MTESPNPKTAWQIFTAAADPNADDALQLKRLPAPPSWRAFKKAGKPEAPDAFALSASKDEIARGADFVCSNELKEAVNAALYLRRPLLLTGKPGTGKSTLIHAVARELRMGPVLRWSITSRSTLRDGLYQYDALGRLNERPPSGQLPPGAEEAEDVGRHVELGPLGTALYPTSWPRALLIDEIDKSDLDLPNDLLNVFEEGEVHISELARVKKEVVDVRTWRSSGTVPVTRGKFVCEQFPFVVLTSNGERTFPAPFLRRCIQFTIQDPKLPELEQIVQNRLGIPIGKATSMVKDFLEQRDKGDVATDQLLNAIFLTFNTSQFPEEQDDKGRTVITRLREMLLKELAQLDSR